VSVKLKRPLEGRRNFEGVLELEDDGRFGLVLIEPQVVEPGRKARVAPPKPGAAKRVEPKVPSKRAASEKAREGTDKDAPAARKLVFALDEIDRARLVPKVEF
jgi:hypothetical protein